MRPLFQSYVSQDMTSTVLLFLSVAGFSYQVYRVSNHYFRYETVTQVQQEPRELMKPGNINFCPRYIDLVDKDRVYNETGIRLRRIQSVKDAYDMEGLLRVEQVFKYTPEPNQVVQECRLRGDHNLLLSFSGKRCQNWLNITKYMTQVRRSPALIIVHSKPFYIRMFFHRRRSTCAT